MFVGRGEGLDRGEGFPTRGGQAWGDGTEAEARRAWTQRVCRWSCVSSLAGRALSAFWGPLVGRAAGGGGAGHQLPPPPALGLWPQTQEEGVRTCSEQEGTGQSAESQDLAVVFGSITE